MNSITIQNREKLEEEIKNVPYPLPKGWKWVRLGEIFDIKRGGSPRPISKYLTTDKDGTSWIKIGDVKEGSKYIVKTKEKIKPEGKKKSRIVKPDDLLLSNSMSYGKAFISKIEGCIHDGWLLLRPVSRDIFIEYFYYLLNSYVIALQFKNNVQGGIVKNLNTEIVKNTIAPLPFKNDKPDLKKQKQIVEKIETIFKEIDKAITLRQKALEDTKKLFESVLNKIFKEAEEDKDNWKWIRLGEIVSTIKGKKPKKLIKENLANYLPYLTADYFREKTLRQFSLPETNLKLIQENDLVMIWDGSKSGDIFISDTKGILASTMVKLILKQENLFYRYLFYILKNYFEELNSELHTD